MAAALSRYHSGALLYRISVYLFLAGLAAIFMFPFYWLLISAFKAKEDIFTLPPEFWPHPWRLGNFVAVFQQTNIVRAFLNSTIIAAGHCTLALFLCSLGGYAFAKYPHAPGRDKLFAFALATMMIPGAVLLIPTFVVLCKLHAINTYWAMIVPGSASAFGIFWMRQFAAENVHDDLLDAARIDGCSRLGTLFRVVLPLSKPPIVTITVFNVIGSWNSFFWPLIVTNSDRIRPLQVGLAYFSREQSTNYTLLMAATTMAIVPLVILFFFAQQQIVQSQARSGLKE